MIQAEVNIIFKVYLISLIWQFVSWPIISWYFKDLNDRGWAICRTLSTLFLALTVWQFGNFGFPVNNNSWFMAVGLIMIVTSLIAYKKRGLLPKKEVFKSLKYIVLEEYLFIVGLVLMAVVRGFSPDIHNLEKFMDFGFINRYLISESLPAMDMWYAGSPINYYSFGHYWASVLIRTLGVAPTVGYNLIIAVIAGLGLSLTFSLTSNLIGKRESGKIVGGLIAAMAVCIGGNSHAFWYLLSHKFSMNEYWYADATRFIYNTIHEFPSYSFVVSDLHGHLLDLPIVLTFLIVFYYWSTHKGLIEEIVMGGLLGIMIMTNTWDLPVYGMLVLVFCLFQLISGKTNIFKLVKSALIIFLSMAIVAIPWWLNFDPISSGIGVVSLRSPLWQLAVLWASGVVSVILASLSVKHSDNKLLVWSIALSALILIAIPEFIYAKDIYPNHPRANTMFKLTYQAFIFMGVCLGAAIGQIMNYRRSFLKFLGIFTCLVIFTGAMIFPVEAFPTFYGDFKEYKGLDGERWFAQDLSERKSVSDYLKAHRDGKSMVEAVGDSYTDYNAISVFSGVPTVVGWRVHEWLWRGGYEPVGARDTEVKSFYENNDNKATGDFVRKYNIGWVVVGKDEFSKYKINEIKLKNLGEVVLATGQTYLIKIK